MSMVNKGKLTSASINMRIRDIENILRHRRIPYPKRSVEFIALIAISCTLFLFLHTKNLNSRLKEMEVKLQPSEFSALGLTGDNHLDESKQHHDRNTLHGTYQYLKSTGQLVHNLADKLNNTMKANMELVFFNRVPKVGSQTLMELMTRLSKLNGFGWHRDKPSRMETIVLNDRDEQQLIDEIKSIYGPATYSKHVAYVNFTKHGNREPIYINLVRDPIERLVSWYYYIRAPWYFIERKQKFPQLRIPDPEWLRKSFDDCILDGYEECTYKQGVGGGLSDHRRQTLFFCGMNRKICMPFNSRRAMQRAKKTVESSYSVVGSFDGDLTNITLTVLEHYIPRFFKGASKVYHSGRNVLTKINKNNVRPTIGAEARELLSRNLTHEIEFYEFCKQRLYKQYIAVKMLN